MKDGGPAFPAHHFDLADNEHGLSVRDYFAAKAMQGIITGLLSNGLHYPSSDDQIGALRAYQIADAMLKERSKT